MSNQTAESFRIIRGSRLFLKFFLWFWAILFLTSLLAGSYVYFFHIEPETRLFEQVQLENLQENGARLAEIHEEEGLKNISPYGLRGIDWLFDESLRNLIEEQTAARIEAKRMDRRFKKYSRRSINIYKKVDENSIINLAEKVLEQGRDELAIIDGRHFQACFIKSQSGAGYVAIKYLSWKQMKKYMLLVKKFFDNLPFFILISLPLCFVLARYMANPIVELSRVAREFSSGNLDARVDSGAEKRFDEVGDLTRDFNLMAERLERMITGQQRLLGDISHELRSPLARMQVAIEILEQKSQQADNKMISKLKLEIARLNELIGRILKINRLNEKRKEPEIIEMMVEPFLKKICDDAQFEVSARNIKVQLKIHNCEKLFADKELIEQAVENLLRNAVKYSPDDSVVEVIAKMNEDDSIFMLDVIDSGPGIAEEHLPKIFEPFYRCEDDRDRKTGGVGLGLAIVYNAIQAHKGKIKVTNLSPGGLKVSLCIPQPE
jgi:two-component system sensor histidine kinase CpxA